MLIGVTGYAQHGKDSIARFLVEEYGFTQMSFAAPLKQLALLVNPYVGYESFDSDRSLERAIRLAEVVEVLGWDDAKTELKEVRRVLQQLGTRAREVLGPDVWVSAFRKTALDEGLARWTADDEYDSYRLDFVKDVVVSDVRFLNEALMIRGQAGLLWRVDRTGFDNGLGTDHPSEAAVATLPVDTVIVNDGTLADLRGEVAGYMAKLGYPVG